MKKWIALAAAAVLSVTLAGCAGSSDTAPAPDPSGNEEPIGGDIVAPISIDANDLQGATVDLIVGQALNINTGDLAVDSYTGEVADPSVAEFTAGKIDETAEFNPGVTALAVGTTEVTMTNEQGGIQPLQFTVVVSEKE